MHLLLFWFTNDTRYASVYIRNFWALDHHYEDNIRIMVTFEDKEPNNEKPFQEKNNQNKLVENIKLQ